MKINKEQEVVMEIHKKKDSKIHKKSDGKVKSKMTSARTKGRVIAGEAGLRSLQRRTLRKLLKRWQRVRLSSGSRSSISR
ncbi:MAG: hypothetical protein E7254_07730 [Lachnospiraceae bacterium]|nr:hypothetical protein [Lachnospiraceae bacterium]